MLCCRQHDGKYTVLVRAYLVAHVPLMLLKVLLACRPFSARRSRWLPAARARFGGHAPLQLHQYAVKPVIARFTKTENMSDKQTACTTGRPFDKSDFSQTLKLKALKVQAKQCQGLMKTFAG